MRKQFENLTNDVVFTMEGRDIPVEAKIETISKIGKVYEGLRVNRVGSNVSACIDLAAFEKMLDANETYEDILRKICDCIEANLDNCPDYTPVTNWEEAKDKLMVVLVPAETNAAVLKTCPHQILNDSDIAVVYKVFVGEDDKGTMATCLVTNSLLTSYGVTAEELRDAAMKSTFQTQGETVIQSLFQKLAGMMGNASEEEMDIISDLEEASNKCKKEPMYYASNVKGVNGASVILRDGVLKSFYDRIQTGFYMLPASVHEWLLVPDDSESISGKTPELVVREFTEMVAAVNDNELLPEELLSYTPYHFDGETFEKAATYAAKTNAA